MRTHSSPSLYHLARLLRKHFSQLKSVEAVFFQREKEAIHVWVVIWIGDKQIERAIQVREVLITEQRPDLRLKFHTIDRRLETRSSVVRMLRSHGAKGAYLRSPTAP